MSYRKNYKKINANTFNKLGNLFVEKGWVIEEGNNSSSLFYRFCELLNCLEEEQQDLIIELTYKYEKVGFDDYSKLIIKVLKEIADTLDVFEELKDIYIMPLVGAKDENKIKSSTLVAYLFQSPQLKYDSKISKKNFKITNLLSPKQINKINESPKTILFLVDDFVGSGNTALSAYNYYVGKNIKSEKIVIISLVSMVTGYNMMRDKNIKFFTGRTVKKGLSDYYMEEELEKKINIMHSIEEVIKPIDEYRLGYEKSEALITLVRTPNNTFPMYWLDKKGNRAPFPRG